MQLRLYLRHRYGVGRSWVHYCFRAGPSRYTGHTPQACALHVWIGSGLSHYAENATSMRWRRVSPNSPVFSKERYVPKVALTCRQCGVGFEVFPAFIRHAEKRGSPVQFCSKECVGAARSAGLVGTKKRKGRSFPCDACGQPVYARPSATERRFCSEECRQTGFKLKLIDRSGPRPERLTGKTISCCICSAEVYRRGSHIKRNVDKTCGDPKCVSAYSRSLWGLEPRSPDVVVLPKPKRKARATNFTGAQRAAWIGTKCKRCGSKQNLSLDHIIPVCAGGKSVQSNAQTLCQPCNNWKAANLDRPYARKRRSLGGYS